MKMKISFLVLPLAFTASAFAQVPAVILSDAFNDGGRSNGTDAQDAAWYYSRDAAYDTIGVYTNHNAGLTDGALGFGVKESATNQMIVAALPSTVSLLTDGHSIEVEFKVSRTTSYNYHSNFRVGFYNAGAVPSVDNFGSAFNSALGYQADIPSIGQNYRYLRLREDTAVDTNRLTDNSNNTTGGLFASEQNTAFALPNYSDPLVNLPVTITFTLTKVATGIELKVSSDLPGTSAYSVIDTVDPLQSFNAVTFGWGNKDKIWLDDISVTTAIPEPSTYAALFGLGALGFVMMRRRRRDC